MRIERKDKLDYKPITITLETEREAEMLLARGETRIMDELSQSFEKTLILKALAKTGGRRIEAANLLGLGRNTLTRKIQELGIDDAT